MVNLPTPLKALVLDSGIIQKESIYEVLCEDGDFELEFERVSTPPQSLDKLKSEVFNIFITDIDLKGFDILDFFRIIKTKSPETLIISVSSFKWEKIGVYAVKQNIIDYLIIPYHSYTELKITIIKAIERFFLAQEKKILRHQLEERTSFGNIIGRNRKMQEVYELIQNVADKDINVLIGGESGTGKDLVAQAIHYNSHRRNGPFIKVNCAAIPDELIESELFGYEKGAFTGAFARRIGKFERAHKGTIFLDEIGDMSLATQAKVLRVIENRELERIGGKELIEIDVRIIAATNKNLKKECKLGNFREDLFYRLNVVSINLPPLRERKEDIVLLIDYFLRKFNKKFNKNVTGLSTDVMTLFTEYAWPGNIREMQNVMESAVALAKGDIIEIEDLPYPLTTPSNNYDVPETAESYEHCEQTDMIKDFEEKQESSLLQQKTVELSSSSGFESTNDTSPDYYIDKLLDVGLKLEEVEKLMVQRALMRTDGVQKEAAKLLGLGKGGMQYKLKKYNIKLKKVVSLEKKEE
jgi:two-component system response regulator AtoC